MVFCADCGSTLVLQPAHTMKETQNKLHVLHLQETWERGMQFPLHPRKLCLSDFSG
jgi:hypothetical protein